MNGWIELNAEDADILFRTMRYFHQEGGIRKIRINTEYEGVKIKVNEGHWSPELGKKVEV